jgi:hypothetical protein
VPSSARRGVFVILDGADEAALTAHLPAQPGQELRQYLAALGAGQRLEFRAAEGLRALVMLGEITRRFFDQSEA